MAGVQPACTTAATVLPTVMSAMHASLMPHPTPAGQPLTAPSPVGYPEGGAGYGWSCVHVLLLCAEQLPPALLRQWHHIAQALLGLAGLVEEAPVGTRTRLRGWGGGVEVC